jgi:predicted DNA-binding transcriptional regulator YafY
MNRTERLYALVEELRAVAPRSRTAAWLADRFEVSVRTIERDVLALQQAGVPLWGSTGPRGGYTIDPAHTLPPVNFTAAEATAIAVALARPGVTPFGQAAGTALRKLVGAMRADDAAAARSLLRRVHLVERADGSADVPALLERAVLERRVVELDYVDRNDVLTEGRPVEPHSFMGDGTWWYLIGWCRRRDGGRSFRIDRIRRARLTDEVAPERDMPPPEHLADQLLRPTLE